MMKKSNVAGVVEIGKSKERLVPFVGEAEVLEGV